MLGCVRGGRVMSSRVHGVLIAALVVIVAVGYAVSTRDKASASGPTPAIKHLYVIMMENRRTDEIIGNTADAPYINMLAQRYNLATNYYGVTHPSLPNYLALLSGDTQGIFDDCMPGTTSFCPPAEFIPGKEYPGLLLTQAQVDHEQAQPHFFTGTNLVDQLESHGLTWRAYMEALPNIGYTGEYFGHRLYAAKHNPFVYFSDIATNPTRMAKVGPFTLDGFKQDLAGDVPNLVWISPNQCNDMHDLSPENATAENLAACAKTDNGADHSVIQLGDKYLSQVVPLIMGSKTWNEGSTIAIVWDENDYSGWTGCCHSPVGVDQTILGGGNAPAIFITSRGGQRVSDTTAYNHYNLLASIERMWGLPCLANACGFRDDELMLHYLL
jgi:phosphatidylinositol-3-phosphatase